MERDALASGSTRRVDAMVAAGAADEVGAPTRAARRRPRARRSASRSCCAGDVEAMKTQHPPLRPRQLTWMRKLPGVSLIDVTGREPEDVAAELHRHCEHGAPCGSRSGRRSATTT